MFHHEAARFRCLKWVEDFEKEKPYQISSGRTKGSLVSNTNITYEQSAAEERVTDMRESLDTFSLDVNGFSAHKIQSEFSAWIDKQKVESEYIPQVVEPLLRRNVDGNEVFVFDWHV